MDMTQKSGLRLSQKHKFSGYRMEKEGFDSPKLHSKAGLSFRQISSTNRDKK